jgi:hypothetical protein
LLFFAVDRSLRILAIVACKRRTDVNKATAV